MHYEILNGYSVLIQLMMETAHYITRILRQNKVTHKETVLHRMVVIRAN